MKKVMSFIAVASAGAVALVSAPASANDPYTYTECDETACFTYWNTGTPEDPNWVLVNIEPKPFPGGRHEN